MDELVVLLIRETGWTFEYATQFVRKTPIKQLNIFISELRYQRDLESYEEASLFGLILAVWANSHSKGKKFKIADFVGQPPRRKPKNLEEAAQKVGIILPSIGGVNV